jgi:hypothetical protein
MREKATTGTLIRGRAMLKRNTLFGVSWLMILLTTSCASVRYIPSTAKDLPPEQLTRLLWDEVDVSWYGEGPGRVCLYKIDGNKLNCESCPNNATAPSGEHEITYLHGPVRGSAFGGSPYSSGVATGKHPNLTYWQVGTKTQKFEGEKIYKWKGRSFEEVPVADK